MNVTPLVRRDLREVRAIDALVYPKPWSLALYLDELSKPDSRVYLAARRPNGDDEVPKGSRSRRRRPNLVGYVGMMAVADDGHVTSVAVHPDCQGEGIGARLMCELHRALLSPDNGLAQPVSAMTLEVRASNHTAQRLYRWLGYAPVGMRKAYYRDGYVRPAAGGQRRRHTEDAVIMWCHDIAGAEHAERLAAVEARLLERQAAASALNTEGATA